MNGSSCGLELTWLSLARMTFLGGWIDADGLDMDGMDVDGRGSGVRSLDDDLSLSLSDLRKDFMAGELKGARSAEQKGRCSCSWREGRPERPTGRSDAREIG